MGSSGGEGGGVGRGVGKYGVVCNCRGLIRGAQRDYVCLAAVVAIDRGLALLGGVRPCTVSTPFLGH